MESLCSAFAGLLRHRYRYTKNYLIPTSCALIALCFSINLSAKSALTVALEGRHNYIDHFPHTVNSKIPFYWQYLSNNRSLPSTMGRQWRHNYNYRLLKNDEKIELVSYNGKKTLFSPKSKNLFLATNNSGETITRNKQFYKWTSKSHSTVFLGSYPITINFSDKATIKLRYRSGLLTRIFDNHGYALELHYNNTGHLSSIKELNGLGIQFKYDQNYRLASSQSSTTTTQYIYPSSPPIQLCNITAPLPQALTIKDDLCNTAESPPTTDFLLSQINDHSTKIDLRPESCQSYFVDYNGIDRGVEIETGMLAHSRYKNFTPTVRSFPVVDFIDGREAVAVSSKDLSSKTYNPTIYPDGIYDSIVRDAKNADSKYLSKLTTLGKVSATEKGITTTITNTQVDTLRMEVVIQAGIATPAQLAQIERARITLLAKWNIKLLTVVIP